MSQEMQDKALTLVAQYTQEKNPEKIIKTHDFAVVWFCKTLLNWKCLVTAKNPNGMYYEVTYNGYTAETYLDVYVKSDNISIPDKRN